MLEVAAAIFAVGVLWELRIMRRRLHELEQAVIDMSLAVDRIYR